MAASKFIETLTTPLREKQTSLILNLTTKELESSRGLLTKRRVKRGWTKFVYNVAFPIIFTVLKAILENAINAYLNGHGL
ncbi:hypothetical protein EPN96_11640 [bacterium]|nr:MAG: hypothetical protein EPN96_11640 [bacterium]